MHVRQHTGYILHTINMYFTSLYTNQEQCLVLRLSLSEEWGLGMRLWCIETSEAWEPGNEATEAWEPGNEATEAWEPGNEAKQFLSVIFASN